MGRREFLKTAMSAVVAVSPIVAFALSGRAEGYDTAPSGSLPVRVGERLPISIFHTDAAEQAKLLAALTPDSAHHPAH